MSSSSFYPENGTVFKMKSIPEEVKGIAVFTNP
jgi:hypothetical protein